MVLQALHAVLLALHLAWARACARARSAADIHLGFGALHARKPKLLLLRAGASAGRAGRAQRRAQGRNSLSVKKEPADQGDCSPPTCMRTMHSLGPCTRSQSSGRCANLRGGAAAQAGFNCRTAIAEPSCSQLAQPRLQSHLPPAAQLKRTRSSLQLQGRSSGKATRQGEQQTPGRAAATSHATNPCNQLEKRCIHAGGPSPVEEGAKVGVQLARQLAQALVLVKRLCRMRLGCTAQSYALPRAVPCCQGRPAPAPYHSAHLTLLSGRANASSMLSPGTAGPPPRRVAAAAHLRTAPACAACCPRRTARCGGRRRGGGGWRPVSGASPKREFSVLCEQT